MTIFGFHLFTNPARELARIGHEKRRKSVRETAQQIRRELGLDPDPRLS